MTARWLEAAGLVALSWLVAVPLSAWFARVRWTAREPVAALIAWQAVGLCGGLALLSAELTMAASRRGGPWHDAVATSVADPGAAGPVGIVGLALFAVSLAWLGGVLVTSFARAARSRREHRLLVELLSRPRHCRRDNYDVIDANTPMAYALPGRTPHVVLSTAAADALSDEELHAVLAHERGHLRQRHSILVQPFVAWQHSLPMLRSPTLARLRVEQLVEMVCDDTACRTADRRALASALETLGSGAAGTAERLHRLTDQRPSRALRVALLSGALLLVLLPPAVLLAIPG